LARVHRAPCLRRAERRARERSTKSGKGGFERKKWGQKGKGREGGNKVGSTFLQGARGGVVPRLSEWGEDLGKARNWQKGCISEKEYARRFDLSGRPPISGERGEATSIKGVSRDSVKEKESLTRPLSLQTEKRGKMTVFTKISFASPAYFSSSLLT